VIYAIPDKNALLVLHGFIKKSPKTPKKEIKTALDRYYDWRDRPCQSDIIKGIILI